MQFFTTLIKQHVRTSDALLFLYRELAKLNHLLTPEHIAEVSALINPLVAGTPLAAEVSIAEAGATTFAGVVEKVDQIAEAVVSQTEPIVSQSVSDESQPVVNSDPAPTSTPAKTWKPKKA